MTNRENDKLTSLQLKQLEGIRSKDVQTRIKSSEFYTLGKQKSTLLWDVWFVNRRTLEKEIMFQDITTESFILLTEIAIKLPYPYWHKIPARMERIAEFIKEVITQLIKPKKHGINNKHISIINQSSSIQTNSEELIENGPNLKETIKDLLSTIRFGQSEQNESRLRTHNRRN